MESIMKKLSTFLLLNIMFGILCFSQTKKQPTLYYYELINKAEMAIVKKQTDIAFNYYKKAFVVNPDKIFSKDLLNAFHCAMDQNNYLIAETYLSLLLKRGISSSFFNKYIISFYNQEEKRCINDIVNRYPNDTIQNSYLNKEIIKLINIDQTTRHYFSNLFNGNYMVDSTYKTDQQCSKKLFDLFVSYGKVPNQKDLGNVDWGSPLSQINYSIIIDHNMSAYMNKMPSDIFDTMIYKAVLSYDFHPAWFARDFSQVDFSHKNRSIRYGNQSIIFPLIIGKTGLPIYIDTLPNIDKSKEFEKLKISVNYNRKKIGLETLEELWDKQEFIKMNAKTKYHKYFFLN